MHGTEVEQNLHCGSPGRRYAASAARAHDTTEAIHDADVRGRSPMRWNSRYLHATHDSVGISHEEVQHDVWGRNMCSTHMLGTL